MKHAIYQQITQRKKQGKKSFAVLIDPDKVNANNIQELVKLSVDAHVDYFFVGGSLVISSYLD
ncbi:MAG TPA: geranylgeranylglyceryl/heptaprenylglyceryl phosphate synthase, partial [Sediminibacterium sp.]|nr:geranylgeranylglyceryl/heptaprenylglyceryl phosphate synthase [Sediminibacterium sp.]